MRFPQIYWGFIYLTTQEATNLKIPRWMVLSHLAEDVAQIVALVDLEYHTPGQRKAAREFYLRCLRRDQWERRPCKAVPRPALLRPSKKADGYRTDSAAHKAARANMSPQKRSEIARMGAIARKKAV